MLGTDQRPFVMGPTKEVRLDAPNGFAGHVDPGAGTLTMAGDVVYSFAGDAFDCTTEPSHLTLTGSGIRRRQRRGHARRRRGDVFCARIARGMPNCSDAHAQFIDDNLVLPSSPGSAALVLGATVRPPVTSPPPPAPAPPSAARRRAERGIGCRGRAVEPGRGGEWRQFTALDFEVELADEPESSCVADRRPDNGSGSRQRFDTIDGLRLERRETAISDWVPTAMTQR